MNFAPLPAVLNLAAVPIAALASAVLAFLSTVGLASVPGFRQSDASRNSLMRALLGVLNVAGLTTYAWTQGITLAPAQLLTLVGTVVLAAGGGHGLYTLIKAGARAGTAGTAGTALTSVAPLAAPSEPSSSQPPAVPPLPSDPTPTPLPVPAVSLTTNGTSPSKIVLSTTQTNI